MNTPGRWQKYRLGDLGDIFGGGTPSTNVAEYWGGGVPWLVPGEVSRRSGLYISVTQRTITEKGLSNSVANLLPPGTVMMTSRATIGEVVINRVPMATNQGFINVVCKPELVQSEFLAYWMQQNKHIFIERAHGVTFKEITKSNFRLVPILLPPLDEQRTIAGALDAVQKARQVRLREAALERERKAALMEYLFTHGTRGEPTKQTEIGEIPESWQLVTLADIVEVKRGQVDPKIEPYASMTHIGPENLESGTGKLLAAKTARELKLISGKYLFTDDDVLYSKIRPYLAKVGLPHFTGVCSADMYPLRPRDESLLRDFLFQYLLTHRFTSRAVSFQTRTGIPKINREQLGRILMPLPPASEQQEITKILNACDAKTAALQNETATLTELFLAMLNQLITGRLSSVPLIEESVAT